MTAVLASIHVRRTPVAAVVAALTRVMKRRGYEIVAEPTGAEPSLLRARVVSRASWVSLAIEEQEDPVPMARALAKDLDAATLASFFWEGEARWTLTSFEGTRRSGVVSLPEAARRAEDGRVALALGPLSRLVGDGRAESGLEVRFASEGASFDRAGAAVYVPADDVARALGRTLGLPELLVDPLDEDGEGAPLAFRPTATSKVGRRERAEREEAARARREDHEGRVHSVGWLAFDAEPRRFGPRLETTFVAVASALAERLGGRPLAARAVEPTTLTERALPGLAERGALRAYAKALEGVAAIELSTRAPLAAVWATFGDGALSVGWSMRGLAAEPARAALARALDSVLDAATGDPRCLGALVACQRTPLSLARRALAYEYLSGHSELALRPHLLRGRVRAPGYRVLVPAPASDVTSAAPPPRFRLERRPAGLLVLHDAADPHEVPPADVDALEAWLHPALPSDAAARPPARRS